MPLRGFLKSKCSSDCEGGYNLLAVGVARLGATLALLVSGEGTFT